SAAWVVFPEPSRPSNEMNTRVIVSRRNNGVRPQCCKVKNWGQAPIFHSQRADVAGRRFAAGVGSDPRQRGAQRGTVRKAALEPAVKCLSRLERRAPSRGEPQLLD